MTKKSSFSPAKAAKAALGTHGFVPHTPELLRSAAWRGRSIHAVRVLEYFELEHLAHAGKENGFLRATHRQLAAHGVSMRFIKPAIAENVARGLLKITHQGGYRGAGRLDPSRYQLTYLPWKFVPIAGAPEYLEPTNEWKSYARRPAQKPQRSENGHDVSATHQKTPSMKATKRERERERYLKVNAPTFGLKDVTRRWAAYEQLILDKYGDGSHDLDAAWITRDRARSRAH
jgi:hypothetical protein